MLSGVARPKGQPETTEYKHLLNEELNNSYTYLLHGAGYYLKS
jgi:hypothetical protein